VTTLVTAAKETMCHSLDRNLQNRLMICSKVAANFIIGKERHPRNTNRVTRANSCVSKTFSSLG